MTSLRLVVRTVIRSIWIQVSYVTIPNINANANAIANANAHASAIASEAWSKIGSRFDKMIDSSTSEYMAGEWPRIVTR